ncbi:MAG: hypothetical protein WC900_07790, partial [Oscillospiraceae bacterium]
HTIHKGVINICEQKQLPDKKIISVTSRGYSFSLGCTELAEEIRYGVSLDTLMTPEVTPPFVSCETSAVTVNYLFIKEHSTLWDAVVNLCLKGLASYPYVAYTNIVRFSAPLNPAVVELSDETIITEFSSGNDFSGVISDVHMRDASGNYNAYNAQCQYALDRNIERHKHLSFDRHWLSDINQGLLYKLDYFRRDAVFKKITYMGFNGEDINDKLSADLNGFEADLLDISKIEIRAGKNGVLTTLTSYN